MSNYDSSDPSDNSSVTSGIESPPQRLSGILKRLGPGLIVAGSIVGSGELIATTKTGAEAGFSLLWLILIGCFIKVFTQIEFGRFTIATGQTTLAGLNQVPGPRFRVNWIVWGWLFMTILVLAQQGGIAGGVGQALSISFPLTENGRQFNEVQDSRVKLKVNQALLQRYQQESGENPSTSQTKQIHHIQSEITLLEKKLSTFSTSPKSNDDIIWAAIIILFTTGLLWVGKYGFIQTFATVMVASFTAVTLFTVIRLQRQPDWSINWSQLWEGLRFSLPEPSADNPSARPLQTALATFGIIGVGAAELIMYPYWCLEKGYARFTGPKEPSDSWMGRARGWMRVMRIDAWCSMAIYTFATVAFFFLGATVLFRTSLNPEGADLIRTLAEMYVPVFGPKAHSMFLFGAVAVLYSTLFVALASTALVASDAVRVFGFRDDSEASKKTWYSRFCLAFPLIALSMLLMVPKSPEKLVLASGVAQALMLPALGCGALFFRYKKCDPELRPGRLWDLFLWLSALGFLVAGAWLAWFKLFS
ncbi:MAG TPA: transmembrane Mn(2+) transporter [Verrucomicrobiales bacterium]|nr:transmembrane Mn(2+) transporter [Verrucomicrobiales bacterium]